MQQVCHSASRVGDLEQAQGLPGPPGPPQKVMGLQLVRGLGPSGQRGCSLPRGYTGPPALGPAWLRARVFHPWTSGWDLRHRRSPLHLSFHGCKVGTIGLLGQ